MSDSESDDAYGPVLPPGFSKQNSKRQHSEDEDAYVPSLPPHMAKNSGNRARAKDSEEEEDMFCPEVPSNLKKDNLKRKEDTDHAHVSKVPKTNPEQEDESEDEDMYGPALPPHLLKKNSQSTSEGKKRVYGPTIPKGFVPPVQVAPPPPEEDSDSEEEDDGFVIGPRPSNEKFNAEEYRMREMEYRARKMKEKLEGKVEAKPLQRESWMTELPEDRKSFCGLEARQFSRKTPQERGDRSVWTDTPADKERKAKMEDQEPVDYTPETYATKKRDEELSKVVEKYNSEKRGKALVDIHKKKKKEKDDGKPKERKPFTREDDMNVNKFDEVQREKILKKASKLNDRFSAGNRKFL